MKKRPTRNTVPTTAPPLPKKRIVHAARKPATTKWVQTAQMPDYLTEEYPEFCG